MVLNGRRGFGLGCARAAATACSVADLSDLVCLGGFRGCWSTAPTSRSRRGSWKRFESSTCTLAQDQYGNYVVQVSVVVAVLRVLGCGGRAEECCLCGRFAVLGHADCDQGWRGAVFSAVLVVTTECLEL